VELSAIKVLEIFRGGEYQNYNHLVVGRKLLCNDDVFGCGLRFCASAFQLDHVDTKNGTRWVEADAAYNHIKQDAQRTRAKRSFGQAVMRSTHQMRSEPELSMAGSLNQEQYNTAYCEGDLVVCQGPPGTGKTRTLAELVRVRFREILEQQTEGWVFCVANSNVAVLNILKWLSRYASLRPFLRHSYSSMYKAFHVTDFKDVDAYRVTPKWVAAPSGIMVCTTGNLRSIMHPRRGHLRSWATQLVLDESSLVWAFDALPLLYQFPNLRGLCMFGDINQLTPYVTRLVRRNFRSVMCIVEDPRPSGRVRHFRLNMQYRMLPCIARVHSPVFYDFAITSVRRYELLDVAVACSYHNSVVHACVY